MSVYENLRLDHQLCFALYAATHAVTRVYRAELGELGLTYPQYLVLLALWDHGPHSVKELAQRLNLDSATVTPLLKRLAAMDLVSRERDRRDERIVRIRPTRQAQALRRRVAHAQSNVACRTGLSTAEFVQLRETLHRLTRTMSAEQEHDSELKTT